MKCRRSLSSNDMLGFPPSVK